MIQNYIFYTINIVCTISPCIMALFGSNSKRCQVNIKLDPRDQMNSCQEICNAVTMIFPTVCKINTHWMYASVTNKYNHQLLHCFSFRYFACGINSYCARIVRFKIVTAISSMQGYVLMGLSINWYSYIILISYQL